jgi:two-component system sensor histidine kinase YesM
MKYVSLKRNLPPHLRFTKSVQAKLTIFFLIVAILPLITLCYFSYNKSSQVVNRQFGSYGMYAVDQLKLHLDLSLKQMDNLTGNILTYLISSPIVIDDQEPNTYNQYLEEKNFKRYLSSLENSNILSVTIITPSGKIIGNDAINPDLLLQSKFWKNFQKMLDKQTAIHKPDYYSSNSVDYVISMAIPIKDHFGLPAGSKILIDMKLDAIMKLVRTFENDTKFHLQVRDLNGEILVQTSPDYIPGDNDIVWSKQLDTEKWVVEARAPYQQFNESSGIIFKYTVLVAILALVLGIAMASFFSFQFTKPIKKMTQSMRRFGQGELSIQTPVNTSDEIGYLGETFNQMTGQIKDLIHEISLTEKLKSEAELKALHYQINPHLLFNTLNSIQWKARLAGQMDIQKMLQHLVVVLEGSFNVKQVLVPLQKELDIIHHFLEIQHYRYGGVFTYNFDIDPELVKCFVPRMAFQPLFENIFSHGFVDGKGHIDFKIAYENNQIKAELFDDGLGIKPEHMKYILVGQKIPDKQGGVGMRNVDERFKLHFGDPYGVTVRSERNKGTKVILQWPKII